MAMDKTEAKDQLDRMNMELRQAMYRTIDARTKPGSLGWGAGVQAKKHMDKAISHWDSIRTNGYTIRNGEIDRA